MSKQIMVNDRTYRRLEALKKTYKAKGFGNMIDKCIDIYIDAFRTPKTKMIEELNQVLDQYHYELDNIDKQLWFIFIASIRAKGVNKITVVKDSIARMETDYIKQQQLSEVN